MDKQPRSANASPAEAQSEGVVTLEGRLSRILYHKDGFLIARLETGECVKGSMDDAQAWGEPIQFFGQWGEHPKYGRQFSFAAHRFARPTSTAAVERYLQRTLSGIGPARAAALASAFGVEAPDVIRANPERVAEVVKGITLPAALEMAKEMSGNLDRERSVLDLETLLAGVRVPASSKVEILKAWGDSAAAFIRENPYALTEFRGIGFQTADAVAMALGFDKRSTFRIRAGIIHFLKEAENDGHTACGAEGLVAGVATLLGIEIAPVRHELGEMATAGSIVLDRFPGLVSRAEILRKEELVASRLLAILGAPKKPEVSAESRGDPGCCSAASERDRFADASGLSAFNRDDDPESESAQDPESAAQPPAANPEPEAVIDEPMKPAPPRPPLNARQREAVEAAVDRGVLILTGPPGTGKTFTIGEIILRLSGHRIALCAPTGKAARRMTEQTGHEATTIHKLLKPTVLGDEPNASACTGFGDEPAKKGKRFGFGHSARCPLTVDAVICDEASMLDVSLAASLLEAIPDGARLILVGDSDQLPSVGPGSVLEDAIASGKLPVVRLEEIVRQDRVGLIIDNCHRIRVGKPLVIENGDRDGDFFFDDRRDEASALERVVDLASRVLPERQDADPYLDVQVITGTRTKGLLSCESINKAMQARLNGAAEQHPWTSLREGDKVIQTSNDYGVGVMNGEIGRVAAIDDEEKTITVRFPDPDREVELPRENNLRLAYAVTVHKFQGSESPVIVAAVARSFGPRLARRNWLYTTISRARSLCVLVGDLPFANEAVTRASSGSRTTCLRRILEG